MVAVAGGKILSVVNTQLLEQKIFPKYYQALKNRTACLIANHGQVLLENLGTTPDTQEIEVFAINI